MVKNLPASAGDTGDVGVNLWRAASVELQSQTWLSMPAHGGQFHSLACENPVPAPFVEETVLVSLHGIGTLVNL